MKKPIKKCLIEFLKDNLNLKTEKKYIVGIKILEKYLYAVHFALNFPRTFILQFSTLHPSTSCTLLNFMIPLRVFLIKIMALKNCRLQKLIIFNSRVYSSTFAMLKMYVMHSSSLYNFVVMLVSI